MEKLGTNYGGWYVPTTAKLNETSIVYSGGVGEDISFDILLADKYKCNIWLIDPTAKSKRHFSEVISYYQSNKQNKFIGNIQPDYYDCINSHRFDTSKFHYVDVGIWNKKDTLKFYKQTNPNYVSQSVISGMFSADYDIVNVDSLASIMKSNNHTKLDLLKLDIEGAEVNVLNQMLDDNIFPTIVCVEFDLKLKKKDQLGTTEKLVDRMKKNYDVLIDDRSNVTFVRR